MIKRYDLIFLPHQGQFAGPCEALRERVEGRFVEYADIAPLEAKAAMFEWRSVEETVPEPEVDVICYSPKDPLSGYMPNVFIDWFGSKRDCGRNVTHWMPVPQPPYHLLTRARAMEG